MKKKTDKIVIVSQNTMLNPMKTPIGIAARNIKKDQLIRYSLFFNTKDILLNFEEKSRVIKLKNKWKKIVVFNYSNRKYNDIIYIGRFELPKKIIHINIDFKTTSKIGIAKNFKNERNKITCEVLMDEKNLRHFMITYGAIVPKINGERKGNKMLKNNLVGLGFTGEPADKSLIGNYLK